MRLSQLEIAFIALTLVSLSSLIVFVGIGKISLDTIWNNLTYFLLAGVFFPMIAFFSLRIKNHNKKNRKTKTYEISKQILFTCIILGLAIPTSGYLIFYDNVKDNKSNPLPAQTTEDGTTFIPSGNVAKSGLPMFNISGNHATLKNFNIKNASKVFSVSGNNTSISNIKGNNIGQMLETGKKSNNTNVENVTVTNPHP